MIGSHANGALPEPPEGFYECFDAGDEVDRAADEGAPRFFKCTDTGNAERFVDAHGKDLRYCAEWNDWLAFDGRRWPRGRKGVADHRAKLTARSIYLEAANVEDPDVRKAISAWAHKSEAQARRAAMVICAQSEPDVAIQFRDLDRDPWLFNVANGTLELHADRFKLRPHRREDLITKVSPIAYDANATAPRWERFLEEVLPDPEVRTFLQRFAGSCLTGDVSDRKFAFFSGTGRNGKSVATKTLRAVLGEYAIVGAPDLLMAKKEQSHPTEIADLYGARLVVCQEVPKGRTLNEQRVKELTGDEGEIKARRMNENFWAFTPTAKIIIVGNHPPRVTDDTDSIWDRMCRVPFDVRIADDRVDRSLFKTLRAELPGILTWCVRGCLAWQEHGLSAPRAIVEATNGYRADEDTLGRFLADCCAFHANARATVKGIADAYAEWSRVNGEREVTRKALAERLTREGCEGRRTNKARGWAGVRLLEPHEIKARDEASDEVTRRDAESSTPPHETITGRTIPLVTSPSVTASPPTSDPPATSPPSPHVHDDGEDYFGDEVPS